MGIDGMAVAIPAVALAGMPFLNYRSWFFRSNLVGYSNRRLIAFSSSMELTVRREVESWDEMPEESITPAARDGCCLVLRRYISLNSTALAHQSHHKLNSKSKSNES